jgi:hypothetical protein
MADSTYRQHDGRKQKFAIKIQTGSEERTKNTNIKERRQGATTIALQDVQPVLQGQLQARLPPLEAETACDHDAPEEPHDSSEQDMEDTQDRQATAAVRILAAAALRTHDVDDHKVPVDSDTALPDGA